MLSQNIQGKVVVITGASSGLGEATARLLAKSGAIVVLGARRADRIEALADELVSMGAKALAVSTDVRTVAKVARRFGIKSFGRIDVMLNNAGVMPLSPLERLKVDEWDQMIDVNLKGVLYGIAAAIPYMKEQKSGHIINVSSVAGHKLFGGSAVYSATKFAVRAVSEGLRQEMGSYNIRTTIISPGAVRNSWNTSVSRTFRKRIRTMWARSECRPKPSLAWWHSPSANLKRSASTRSCSGRRPRNSDHTREVSSRPRHLSHESASAWFLQKDPGSLPRNPKAAVAVIVPGIFHKALLGKD